jgi:hypothetical protein
MNPMQFLKNTNTKHKNDKKSMVIRVFYLHLIFIHERRNKVLPDISESLQAVSSPFFSVSPIFIPLNYVDCLNFAPV